MPRYRFQWAAVPQPLLRRLARDLELSGDTVGALSQAYGKRPREVFVQDAWPILRDGWLARDTAARREVVAALLERGLGEKNLPVRNREQQRAYLATCRNSPALRRIVLTVFHALGDAPALATARMMQEFYADLARRLAEDERVEQMAEDLGHQLEGDDEAELPGEVDRWIGPAWPAFEDRLREALESRQEFTIRLPEIANAHWFLMTPTLSVTYAGDRVRLELRSGTPAGLPRELPDHLSVAMAAYGWVEAPTPQTAQLRRKTYLYVLPAVLAEDEAVVAAFVVATMREVLSIPHPAFLTVDGADLSVGQTPLEGESADLFARDDEDTEGYTAEPEDRVAVFDIATAEQMQQLVDDALTDRFGEPPPRDDDGDIELDLRGFTCYVRIAQYGAYLTLFCPLLRGVPLSPRNMIRVNELNQQYKIVKLTLEGRGVLYATIDLWCWPFVPLLLRQAVDGMAVVVSGAEELQESLGGERCG